MRIEIGLILSLMTMSDASRILGIFPYPSYSHQVVYSSVTLELARNGHELFIFTTDPINNPNLKNYVEVDMHFLYKNLSTSVNFYDESFFNIFTNLAKFMATVSDATLSHPILQKIISSNSTKKFDLLLAPSFLLESLYTVSVRLDIPVIVISSFPITALQKFMFRNPLETAYTPETFLGYKDDMNFWERIYNLYFVLKSLYAWKFINIPLQDAVVRKHFGDEMPPVSQLFSRLSMLFTYEHPFFAYPRSYVPVIVHIGGLRMAQGKDQSTPSQDLQEIMDSATDGFIYFSLGSNLKSVNLPKQSISTFLEVFSELPYKIIWKFETDALSNKSDNVIIRKWMPQQAILAHPNIRLFLFQGGLQSMEEAIEFEVPLIGFPVFSDQMLNLNRLQTFGVAKQLNIRELDKKSLRSAIWEVATNSCYKENMVKLRKLLHDTPYDVRNQVVWWVEHVIRHKGLSHLYTRSRDMPFYQLIYLDLILLILVSLIFIFYVGRLILCRAMRYALRNFRKKSTTLKKTKKTE